MTIIAPDILLPKENTDLNKWAVVACDQFTKSSKYWEELKATVAGKPSALNLILPEIYLNSDNKKEIKNINEKMRQYLSDDIFNVYKNSIILIERTTKFNNKRLGILLAIDLEDYSFNLNEKPLIRATEGTILERIPIRVQIRENAPLELSHIMLLMDDREDFIIENIYKNRTGLEILYDFELNMEGGHIKGYKIDDNKGLIDKLNGLLNEDKLIKKYGKPEKMLFAVGDGNHSLAAAKTCWENIKKTLTKKEQLNHPARYALCEVVNIHDENLKFEPIHRILLNIDNKKFLSALKDSLKDFDSLGKVIIKDKTVDIKLPSNTAKAYNEVQNFINGYLKAFSGEVDYIHGEKDLSEICKNKNALGIIMPALKKDELFAYVIKNGPLARKTFSMGEAVEKRYYLEARKIKL